ncbi:tyrosine-type recombinase/integrase [Flavobacterium sp.]|uniref:tyrosine-type recombinase/integrase n=1 Tax=Flavobacterium sp. TaxID=239 RepID=UPI00391C628F
MRRIEIYIQNAPVNAPVKITINVMEDLFSEVKLYKTTDKDGNPTIVPGKAWYIYYYYRNPVTGLMEKKQDTWKINRYKTIAERTKAGNASVKAQLLLLQNGFNPFHAEGIPIVKDNFDFENYTVKDAITYALNNKAGELKTATIDDYTTRAGVFVEWCVNNGLDGLNVRELKEVHMIGFFNHLVAPDGRNLGMTSQDNYKRALSSLFGKLKKDKLIEKNIVDFETSKDEPLKNTPFTGPEVLKIKEYLLANDVQLYNYILFVIYEFLRPVEIVRLKAENINFKEKTLAVETKTSRKKTKKLISPVIEYLESINVDSLASGVHIFTNTGKFEIWDAKEKTKTDHFGNRFKKVKLALGFGKDYGIYSFRHTAALDLYKTFTKNGATHTEAVSKLMPIIGHSNEETTEKYLRDVGALLPKDYGEFYTLDF